MMAVDQLPFSTVDKRGFRYFMKTVAPLYDLRGRKTFTSLMDSRYLTLKENLILKLDAAICFSITCDNWTDIKSQSYLGVTGHFLMPDLTIINANIGVFPLDERHTAEYLKESLQNVFDEFKSKKSKLMCVTADDAANIKRALQDFAGPGKQLGCYAHILSHLVPDALKFDDPEMKKLLEIIGRVRSIVSFVKRSICASDELKRLQMILDGKADGDCLHFKKDMEVRWNSTLFMIERYLELEKHVGPVLRASNSKKAPKNLFLEDIEILKDSAELMKIVGSAVNDASGSTYTTSSIIIPLSSCMRQQIEVVKTTTNSGKIFKQQLIEQMNRRFKDFESNKILTIATLFDPRFKNLHFERAMTTVYAKNEIKSIIEITSPPSESTNKPAPKTINKNSLWSRHEAMLSRVGESDVTSDIDTQLNQYLREPYMDMDTDPIQAWKTLKFSFPKMYEVAIRYLSIQGSSVPSERLFSKAGTIVSQERSRLLGKRVNKLVFLASLSQDDWNLG